MHQPRPGLPPQHPQMYALNFALDEQRETLAAIWQLTHELTGLSLIAEPQVAAVKAPWWAEELERWAQNQARHPATRGLNQLAARQSVVSAVERLFMACLTELTKPHSGEEVEFWRRCEDHAMGLGVVAAYLGEDQTAVLAGYQAVGGGIAAVERLLTAAADARAGRIRLPLDTVATAGLDTQKLAGRPPDAAFIDIRRRFASDASQRLRNGVEQIRTAPQLARHRYVLVLSALYDDCAGLLCGPRPVVTWPTPLAQLWMAWQTARRAR